MDLRSISRCLPPKDVTSIALQKDIEVALGPDAISYPTVTK
jgi:hypothetical protein